VVLIHILQYLTRYPEYHEYQEYQEYHEVHALQLPTTNAPFAPLSDGHTKVLTLLMDILHAHVTMDPESLRVAAKNKDLDKSLRVAVKNKDLDLQLLPTKLTDHTMPPADSPVQLAALSRIQPLAPPVASLPIPCTPVHQQVAPTSGTTALAVTL